MVKKTLEGEEVKTKASDLSKAVLQELLKDPNTVTSAQALLTQIILNQETYHVVISVLNQVLSDPVMLKKSEEFTKMTLHNVLNDSLIQTFLTGQLVLLINRPEVQATVTQVLDRMMKDPQVQNSMALFFKQVFSSPYILEQARELAKTTGQATLSDEQLIEAGKTYLITVLQNRELQEAAAESLWKSLKIAVLPSFLKSQAGRHQEAQETDSEYDSSPSTPVGVTNLAHLNNS